MPTRLWGAPEREGDASYEVNPAYTHVELFITERCA